MFALIQIIGFLYICGLIGKCVGWVIGASLTPYYQNKPKTIKQPYRPFTGRRKYILHVCWALYFISLFSVILLILQGGM